MARRYHIHVDVNEEQALRIKQAAHKAHLLPWQYMLDRVLRVADHETKLLAEAVANPPPEDIDREGPAQEAAGQDQGQGQAAGKARPEDGASPEAVRERLLKRRRMDQVLARDFSPMP